MEESHSPPGPSQEPQESTPEIKIDPELQNLLAPLSEAEYGLLEKDICEHGCVTPITVDQDGTLIEGHNRHDICTKHNVHFSTRVLHFESREATKQWMLEHQLARRNLTDFQRAEIALHLKPFFAAQGKKNQKAAGGALSEKSTKAVDAHKEVAKLAGTSTNTMTKVEYILKHADEETKKKLRRGEPKLSINKVHKELKNLYEPGTSAKADDVEPADKPEGKPKKKDRVDALLAQIRESYVKLSENDRDRFKDGLYEFLDEFGYFDDEDEPEEEDEEGD